MRGHYSARGQIGTGPVWAALAGPAWAQHSIVIWASTGSYNIPLRRLGKALYKKTYVSPSQIMPIPKAAARKNTRKGGRKRALSRVLTSTPVRDESVVNKTNRQTKINKIKKARKSLFCKVSSDSESLFLFFYFNLYIYPPDSQESDGGANT